METRVVAQNGCPIVQVGYNKMFVFYNVEQKYGEASICGKISTPEWITCAVGDGEHYGGHLYTGHSGKLGGTARWERWNPKAGLRMLEVLVGATPAKDVEHMQVNNRDGTLMTAHADGSILVWGATSGIRLRTLHEGRSRVIASEGKNWDTEGEDRVKQMVFHETTQLLLVLQADGRILARDPRNGSKGPLWTAGPPAAVPCIFKASIYDRNWLPTAGQGTVCLQTEGRHFFTGHAKKGGVKKWLIQDGTEVTSAETSGDVKCMKLESGCAGMVLVGEQPGCITCFSMESLEIKWKAPLIGHSPRCLAFETETNLLYVGVEDGILKVNVKDRNLKTKAEEGISKVNIKKEAVDSPTAKLPGDAEASREQTEAEVHHCMFLAVLPGSDGTRRLLIYDRHMAFYAVVPESADKPHNDVLPASDPGSASPFKFPCCSSAASSAARDHYITDDPLHWMTCQLFLVKEHSLLLTAPFQEEELHIWSAITMMKVAVVRTGFKGSGNVVCKLVAMPRNSGQAESPLLVILGKSLSGPADEWVRMESNLYLFDVAKMTDWLRGKLQEGSPTLPMSFNFDEEYKPWLCNGRPKVVLPEISFANESLVDVPACVSSGVDAWEAPFILGDQVVVSDANDGCLVFMRNPEEGGGPWLSQAAIKDGKVAWNIPMKQKARFFVWSAPDCLMANSDGGSTITCWASATGKEQWSSTTHCRIIAMMTYSTSLLVMCADGSLSKLASATGDVNFVTQTGPDPLSHSSAVLAVADEFVLSAVTHEVSEEANTGLSLTAWGLGSGRLIKQKLLTSKISSLYQGSDPSTIFTGHSDGNITMWKVGDDNLRHIWKMKIQIHNVLAMCNAGTYLVTMSPFRVLAVHRRSMEWFNVASSIVLGDTWVQQFQDSFLPGWYCYFKKIAGLGTSFMQMMSFVVKQNQESHFDERFRAVVNCMASLGFSQLERAYVILFYLACGIIMVFLLLVRFQEVVEWRKFLKPKSVFLQMFAIGTFGCCTLLAGPAFLPLSNALFSSLQCETSEEDGRSFLILDKSIECWSPRHLYGMVLVASVLYIPYFFMVFRIVRADFNLNLLEIQWNFFNTSRDTVATVENRTLSHKLMAKGQFYAQLAVLTKLALSFLNVVMLTDLLVADPRSRDLIMNVVQIAFALALLVTNFVNQQFWDFRILGVTPNAIQASLDTGIVWAYVFNFYADYEHIMEPITNVLLGTLVSVCVGLLVRHVWEDRSGRKQPRGFMVEDERTCTMAVQAKQRASEALPLLPIHRISTGSHF